MTVSHLPKFPSVFLFLLTIFSLQQQPAYARYSCRLGGDHTVFYNATNNTFIENNDFLDFDSNSDSDFPANITKFKARKCSCRYSDDYCIITPNNENTCSIPRWRSESQLTYCYRIESYEGILTLFWLPSIFVLVICTVLPCTSTLGKNTVLYVAQLKVNLFGVVPCFCPLWYFCARRANERTVENLLRQEMESITEHIAIELSTILGIANSINNSNSSSSSNSNNNNNETDDDGMVEQLVLKLRTKPINADHQFVFEDKTCLICMSSLEEGQRMGDISCGHSFHVDCLKEWIERRNACPLCNAEVAESHIVRVSKEEALEGVLRRRRRDGDGDDMNGDNASVDEETRNHFEQLREIYRRRSWRRIHGA